MDTREKKIITDFVEMNRRLYDKAVEENDNNKIIPMWAALFAAESLAKQLGIMQENA